MTFELTAKQKELRKVAGSSAMHILAYGGSRSGKTFGFCYCVATRALMASTSRHLIARLHNIDVRQSVLMDTWPSMMRRAYPDVGYKTNKTDQYVTLENGAEIWLAGLDDKERVEKILGKEYATIYVNEASQVAYETILILRTRLAQGCEKYDGSPLNLKAYYDLNPVGKGHWTYKEFVELVRPENGIALDPETRRHIVMNPMDNLDNLPAAYIDALRDLPERQKQRFLEGKYLSEVPGALWPIDTLDRNRVDAAPKLGRIIIGVDPSGSDGTGGDRQGIVVVGRGHDGIGYVLEDASVRLPPAGWAGLIAQLYKRYRADCIVAEVNFGGAMVEHTIKTAAPNAPVKVIHTSRGKHIRAEPIAALYEKDKVKHVGRFTNLEDQMGMFTSTGYLGGDSPDRVDALVWALDELMLGSNYYLGNV